MSGNRFSKTCSMEHFRAARPQGSRRRRRPGASRRAMCATHRRSRSAPIKIGFQAHRTGIGAAYGRWYEKTTDAAVKAINDAGGIDGRPVEVIVEDDGTDPEARRRGGRQVRHPAQDRHRLRHAVLACGDRLGARRRRAEDPLLRRQRRPSRRLDQAQPLLLPARHHRREEPDPGDGAVDRRQCRQEGHA